MRLLSTTQRLTSEKTTATVFVRPVRIFAAMAGTRKTKSILTAPAFELRRILPVPKLDPGLILLAPGLLSYKRAPCAAHVQYASDIRSCLGTIGQSRSAAADVIRQSGTIRLHPYESAREDFVRAEIFGNLTVYKCSVDHGFVLRFCRLSGIIIW